MTPTEDQAIRVARTVEALACTEQVTESGCWVWTKGQVNGYGRIRVNGRSTYVHRLVYELFVGPIPEGLILDHLCRVRPCCNPYHLQPVTNKENILRGESPPAQQARKTHCCNGHELSGKNVKEYAGTHRRICQMCHFAYVKKYSLKLQAIRAQAGQEESK